MIKYSQYLLESYQCREKLSVYYLTWQRVQDHLSVHPPWRFLSFIVLQHWIIVDKIGFFDTNRKGQQSENQSLQMD